MSFSNQVRQEVGKRRIYNKLEALIELSAILKTNASISIRNAFFNINFSTENADVSKRIYKLIELLYDYEPTISFLRNDNIQKEGIYNISIEDETIVNSLLTNAGIDIYGDYTINTSTLIQRLDDSNGNKKSAFIRGAFLGAGSIVEPKKNYHLEIVISKKEDHDFIKTILDSINLEPLSAKRKGKNILYYKNSDKISDFLAFIGATNCMLELENIKAMKDVRNNVNRQVNCDTANINKTLNASNKHIEQINYIIETKKFNQLEENLKDLAIKRIENPGLPLKALGEILDPPLSKSGVNHRLKKIEEFYKKIEKPYI